MHLKYNPEDYNLWLHYYAAQAAQTGYGMEGFRGLPYQRGAGLGSFFRSLFRMAIPVIKGIGKEAGTRALSAGADVLTDLAQGRPLMESTKRQTSKLLKEASEALQTGEGLGRRPKSININNYPDTFTKTKQKKRKHVSNRY